MKVLREGSIQPVDQTWWHGRAIRCNDCGFMAELSPEDTQPGASTVQASRTVVSMPCPTKGCGGTARLTKDEAKFYAAAGVNRK